MRYLSLGLLALALAAPARAQSSASVPDKVAPRLVTLTGCVTAGAKANTYMLTNVAASDAPIGTSGSTVAPPFYWLDSPGKLKAHVGHKVAISGMLDDDVDKTKVTHEDGLLKVERERTKDVRVPAASPAGAATPDGTRAGFKVKVKTVTMLAERCG